MILPNEEPTDSDSEWRILSEEIQSLIHSSEELQKILEEKIKECRSSRVESSDIDDGRR